MIEKTSSTPPQIQSGGLNVDEDYIHFYDGKMEGHNEL